MNSTMRVLWAVNIPLPAASEALGLPATPFGGWLSTMTLRLATVPGLQLGVVMRAPVDTVRAADVGGIRYYALPQVGRGGLDARPEDCRFILDDFKPDLFHAEGSEMAYSRRFLERWHGPKLLSMQGVINGYEPYELGMIRIGTALGSLRPRQLLTTLALWVNKQWRFMPRLRGERAAMALAGHVMGRTTWDRAHAWALNPHAQYHHCNRTLRDPFYRIRWSPGAHRPHTIFVGNAAAARKGVHVLLDALVLLRREYPDARMIVAGEPPLTRGSWLRRTLSYPSLLNDRIDQLGLRNAVEFTGLLDGSSMAQRMSACHVYAMTSLIENSPNTLGEAMMLGMPCVSAYSGGAPDMARDDVEALLYRAEDSVMLAWQIKRCFDSETLCVRIGQAAHERAMKTHDPEANLRDLLTAYRTILDQERPS